jgi:thiol-disulfide isomerase/thioredoxin
MQGLPGGVEFNAMSGAEVEPLLNGAEELKGSSLSGQERDHLFLSSFPDERQFKEVSGISGLDSPSDGRAFGYLVYDHEGYLDVVVVSSNAPWVAAYRNQIGDLAHAGHGPLGHMLALRFTGASHAATPSGEWSNRDGYGAMVEVELPGGSKLIREHRAGEGFSAQNSATMLIGLGEHERAAKISVRWPSGKVHAQADVPSGSLVLAYEDPSRSPNGSAFQVEPYPLPVATPPAATSVADRLELPYLEERFGAAKLNMISMMATWCAACRAELPELADLRAQFSAEDLAMYGFPADVKEDSALLSGYVTEAQPAYELLAEVPKDQVRSLVAYLKDELGSEDLPQTVVTDSLGRVLLTRYGAPSVSELRRLLDLVRSPALQAPRGAQ